MYNVSAGIKSDDSTLGEIACVKETLGETACQRLFHPDCSKYFNFDISKVLSAK